MRAATLGPVPFIFGAIQDSLTGSVASAITLKRLFHGPTRSTPQRGDQFIQLVRDGLHLGLGRRIADGQAEQADGVGVGAAAVDGGDDGGVQVGGGHFAGRALRAGRDGERAIGAAVTS